MLGSLTNLINGIGGTTTSASGSGSLTTNIVNDVVNGVTGGLPTDPGTTGSALGAILIGSGSASSPLSPIVDVGASGAGISATLLSQIGAGVSLDDPSLLLSTANGNPNGNTPDAFVAAQGQRTAGTSGDDMLLGGAGPDDIHGGSGRDTILGGAGNDHLYGFGSTGGVDGADMIFGNDGNDYIQGNAGADTLSGGEGSDRMFGGADNDVISGDAGNDSINGNFGDDQIDGGTGNDMLRGGKGDDRLLGGDGDDWLQGDLGADVVTGGAGADVFAFRGNDAPLLDLDLLLGRGNIVTDYTDGVDHISLGFRPTAVAHLTAPTVAGAMAFASSYLVGMGNGAVAAVGIGDDTFLFYSSTGGAVADSVIGLKNVASASLDTLDFI